MHFFVAVVVFDMETHSDSPHSNSGGQGHLVTLTKMTFQLSVKIFKQLNP